MRVLLSLVACSVLPAWCLTPAPPCQDPPGSTAVWCDHTQDLDTRVNALVDDLTTDEKSSLMVNGAAAVDRIHWPKYNWWSEALHGLARDGMATSFPQICGVGATYNKTLFHALGDMTATEARGKNNALPGGLYQGLTLWAPNVNIFRDPRWGRGQETPGEDPTLTAAYGVEYITGLQGDDKTYLKASACLKHYAAYSEETDRGSFPAVVNKQDMADTYLPSFQAGVEQGHASGLMCSYNGETYGSGIYGEGTQAQHGAIPSCANKGLLTDLVRKTWKFDGYITSDCGAVYGVEKDHHYTNTTAQTVNAVLQAGMDTDCGGYMNTDTMKKLLDSQDVAVELVDTALKRLFRVQFRLGFADPLELVPFSTVNGYDETVVNTIEHQALAKEAADQSLVLLKNDDNSLPFTASNNLKLAVLGRNANATRNMQGNYFGDAPFLISPLMGLSEYAKTTYANGSDIAAAVELATTADAVVLVVGLVSEADKNPDEAEGRDRTTLILPGTQDDLISQVSAAAAAKNIPVVLVVMSGSPVDITAARDNDNVHAIMWCGYPGQSGGSAIADAVFGQTNAFGKLSMTWYPESFVKSVAIKDMGFRPNATTGNPGRTHRFYTGTPVFKFGAGLSYTTFATKLVVPSALPVSTVQSLLQEGSEAIAFTATVTVANTGGRGGDAVLLLFATPPNAGEDGVPLQQLVSFDRVSLSAGETTQVELSVPARALSLVSPSGDWQPAHGVWQFWMGKEDGSAEPEETSSLMLQIQ